MTNAQKKSSNRSLTRSQRFPSETPSKLPAPNPGPSVETALVRLEQARKGVVINTRVALRLGTVRGFGGYRGAAGTRSGVRR